MDGLEEFPDLDALLGSLFPGMRSASYVDACAAGVSGVGSSPKMATVVTQDGKGEEKSDQIGAYFKKLTLCCQFGNKCLKKRIQNRSMETVPPNKES